MPYYGCSQCHRAAENSERLCGRCRQVADEQREQEVSKMFDDFAECQTIDVDMRRRWQSALWYVRRIEKRVDWFSELRARDEKQVAELKQQIAELEQQIEELSATNDGHFRVNHDR